MGAKIKALRRYKGLTQQQLADACGIHRITLARIEHGGYSPSVDVAAKIAVALGVTIDELVREVG